MSRFDTQQGKLPSQTVPNVWNVSAISVSYMMSPLHEEPAVYPVEIVSVVSSLRKHGVSFDLPLNLHISNNVPYAPFIIYPSTLLITNIAHLNYRLLGLCLCRESLLHKNRQFNKL